MQAVRGESLRAMQSLRGESLRAMQSLRGEEPVCAVQSV